MAQLACSRQARFQLKLKLQVGPECGNICENICRNICENENDADANIVNIVSRECNIVKKMCLEHGKGAILKKYKKRIWTKIKKTGLFGYRTVISVNWICPEATTQPHLV